LLADLLKPPRDKRPNISDAMQHADTTRMQIEFNHWADLLRTASGQDLSLQPGRSNKEPD